MISAQARGARREGDDSGPRPRRRALIIAAAAAALALACYLIELSVHPLYAMLTWFDLGVYRQAGLIALHQPGQLYAWHLAQGIRFTYTPFAAVLFAAGAALPWAVLGWLMTVLSLGALALTGWLMAGALGWVLCALTGLLVSPISWDHHWVWIVPILLVAADAAMRYRGAVRWACWAAGAALALVFFAWPPWTGLHARGLLGFFPGPGMAASVLYHAHGIQLLGFNLFVLAGLAIYALSLVMAVLIWRRSRPGQPQQPPAQTQPGLPAGERAAAQ